MKQSFYVCDRCFKPLQVNPDLPITIYLETNETGETTMIKGDLCDSCYDSLVKWFGKTNPKTNLQFPLRYRGYYR